MYGIEEYLEDDMGGWRDTLKDIANTTMNSSFESSSSESESSNDDDNPSQSSNFVEAIDRFNSKKFREHMRLIRNTVNFLIERFKSTQYFPKGHQYIKWPQHDEIQEITSKFEAKKGIPGIIGAIDCTHITIRAPTTSKESFFDRKKCYSITLQAVVDTDKRFRSIARGEPGSLHDLRVLRRSELYRRAQENRENLFPNDTILLGDSAYVPSNWLVPPFKNYGSQTETQIRFNIFNHSNSGGKHFWAPKNTVQEAASFLTYL